MKFIFVLLSLVSVQSFAATAECVLVHSTYSTKDYAHYELGASSEISRKQVELKAGSVELKDRVYPVSYTVNFSWQSGISGNLLVKVDQPGPEDFGRVGVSEDLNLEVQDLYNGGMDRYSLSCQLL